MVKFSRSPTEDELENDPFFEAIWQALKDYDVKRPGCVGYAAINGNDICHILDAIKSIRENLEQEIKCLRSVLSEWEQDKSCYIKMIEADRLRDIRKLDSNLFED